MKKLQIFISSTYEDLKEERQSAVEAVLQNNHIPAGMELFKSSNRSQLEVIKKWINESDIYMLILGGRYGSIEPISGYSYTEVEYRYALDHDIPVFALVLDDSFLYKKKGDHPSLNVFEEANKEKYQQFKQLVMSNIIRHVSSLEQIKTEVGYSIREFERDPEIEFQGWIRPSSSTNKETFVVSSTYTATAKKHDEELLNRVIEFFEEEHHLYTIEYIATQCFYEHEIYGELADFIHWGNKPSVTFINQEIKQEFALFLSVLDNYTWFLAKNFFTRRGTLSNRQYLYPDLNPDFGSVKREHAERYFKAIQDLNAITGQVKEMYQNLVQKSQILIHS